MYRLDGSRKARLRWISGWILACSSLAPGIAAAQATSCRIPADTSIRAEDGTPRKTPIQGYLLALSWSPQYCRSNTEDAQCDTANGRFGFILHGLWPEGEGRNYPQWCAPAAKLAPAIVRAQFCTTPSAQLIQHEWAKHGTCATANAADYFAASRTLYGAVRYPDMAALSRRATLDVGAFKRAFAAANPSIRPSGMTVTTDRDGGWLREVRVCLNKAMRPEPCPRGRSGGAPDGAALKIWRGAALR